MCEPGKPSSSVVPQNLLDCIIILEKASSQFSWKITRNLKSFSLVIKSFGAKNAMSLKDSQDCLWNGSSGQIY